MFKDHSSTAAWPRPARSASAYSAYERSSSAFSASGASSGFFGGAASPFHTQPTVQGERLGAMPLASTRRDMERPVWEPSRDWNGDASAPARVRAVPVFVPRSSFWSAARGSGERDMRVRTAVAAGEEDANRLLNEEIDRREGAERLVRAAERDNDELRRSVTQLHGHIADMQQRVDRLTQENLRMSIGRFPDAPQLARELDDARELIAELEARLRDASAPTTHLRGQIADLQRRAELLMAERDAIEAERQRLESLAATAEETGAALDTTRRELQETQAQLRAATEAVDKTQLQHAEHLRRFNRLVDEKKAVEEDLTTANLQVADLRDRVLKTESQLQVEIATREATERLIEVERRRSLDVQTRANETVAHWQMQLDAAKAELVALDGARNEVAVAMAQQLSLQQQLAAERAHGRRALEAEQLRAKAEVADSVASAEAAAAAAEAEAAEQKEALASRMEQLEATAMALQQENSALRTKASALAEAVTAAEEERDAAAIRVAELQQRPAGQPSSSSSERSTSLSQPAVQHAVREAVAAVASPPRENGTRGGDAAANDVLRAALVHQAALMAARDVARTAKAPSVSPPAVRPPSTVVASTQCSAEREQHERRDLASDGSAGAGDEAKEVADARSAAAAAVAAAAAQTARADELALEVARVHAIAEARARDAQVSAAQHETAIAHMEELRAALASAQSELEATRHAAEQMQRELDEHVHRPSKIAGESFDELLHDDDDDEDEDEAAEHHENVGETAAPATGEEEKEEEERRRPSARESELAHGSFDHLSAAEHVADGVARTAADRSRIEALTTKLARRNVTVKELRTSLRKMLRRIELLEAGHVMQLGAVHRSSTARVDAMHKELTTIQALILAEQQQQQQQQRAPRVSELRRREGVDDADAQPKARARRESSVTPRLSAARRATPRRSTTVDALLGPAPAAAASEVLGAETSGSSSGSGTAPGTSAADAAQPSSQVEASSAATNLMTDDELLAGGSAAPVGTAAAPSPPPRKTPTRQAAPATPPAPVSPKKRSTPSKSGPKSPKASPRSPRQSASPRPSAAPARQSTSPRTPTSAKKSRSTTPKKKAAPAKKKASKAPKSKSKSRKGN